MNNGWTGREAANLWQRCDERRASLPDVAGARLECYAPAPKRGFCKESTKSWPMKATS